MLEKTFQKKVKTFLESLPNSWCYKSNDIGTRGIPDYVVCISGHFIALELKATLDKKSKSRKLQEYNLNKINKIGGYGFFCAPENWEGLKEILLSLATEGEKNAG